MGVFNDHSGVNCGNRFNYNYRSDRRIIVNVHLNDENNPMEYSTIEHVLKVEYRYNKASETYLVYLETDANFIAIPVEGIESIEIKEE